MPNEQQDQKPNVFTYTPKQDESTGIRVEVYSSGFGDIEMYDDDAAACMFVDRSDLDAIIAGLTDLRDRMRAR